MDATRQLRQQTIDSLIEQSNGNSVGAAVNLWELLSSQIVSIIGESGFNSLYARSLHISQSTYPWLAAGALTLQSDLRFSDLKITLSKQPTAEARAANRLLLITFTDILALLIGEQLTLRILNLAWSNDVLESTNKEFRNE